MEAPVLSSSYTGIFDFFSSVKLFDHLLFPSSLLNLPVTLSGSSLIPGDAPLVFGPPGSATCFVWHI
jgi:hypothetical protein